MNYIKINQEILPEDQALISVKHRACRFGDGLFESCKITSKIIYNFEAHLQRLKLGLAAIKINFDLSDLEMQVYELIDKNNIIEGSVRISISRGIGSRGYFPITSEPLLIIETEPLTPSFFTPINLWLGGITKISLNALPVNYKLSQGLNSTLAIITARENNCFDSLILNDDGQVCETASANIFWVKDDILYTPEKSCGILLGTTREKIITLSPITVKMVTSTLSELLAADEIFITNCRIGVIAIDKIMPVNQSFIQKKYSKIFSDLLNWDISNYVQNKKNQLA